MMEFFQVLIEMKDILMIRIENILKVEEWNLQKVL